MNRTPEPENDAPILMLREGHVATLRLNRPRVRNALNNATIQMLVDLLATIDEDDELRVIIITGDERAFAAGADISEMVDADVVEMQLRPRLAQWDRIRKTRKPMIAAVSGFALGGGCELAMACDIIVATETAMFGQPEIKLGIIPGGGGTQRLVRAAGKARAMELILTGRMFSAAEAFELGLVTKVVPPERYLIEAQRLAHEIAALPPLAVQLAKEAVSKAFDLSIESGLEFERKNFNLLFATDDRREGMRAFLEKRSPSFTGR